MPSLLFRYCSLFLPHLRTLTQQKRSENCLRFGTGGPNLCLYPLLSRNIVFCPALTMAARTKKAKRFAHTITGISVHYRDFEHAYVYWIWLRGSASYVIIEYSPLNWPITASALRDIIIALIEYSLFSAEGWLYTIDRRTQRVFRDVKHISRCITSPQGNLDFLSIFRGFAWRAEVLTVSLSLFL